MPPKTDNAKGNAKIKSKEHRWTAKEMAEHKEGIKKIAAELSALPMYGKRIVHHDLCLLLGIVPENFRGKKRGEFNTEQTLPATVPKAPEHDAPVKEPKVKWQKTEIGKALDVTAHIEAKVDGEVPRDKNLCDAWKNVGGAVGATIKRGILKNQDAPTIIARINEVQLVGSTPTGVIDAYGMLFQDEGYTGLTAEQRKARQDANRADRLKKKEDKSKTK